MSALGLGVQALVHRFGPAKGPARRTVLRARVVLEVPAGVDLAVVPGLLHDALVAALAAAGVEARACQVGLATDPGWAGAGPRPIAPPAGPARG